MLVHQIYCLRDKPPFLIMDKLPSEMIIINLINHHQKSMYSHQKNKVGPKEEIWIQTEEVYNYSPKIL